MTGGPTESAGNLFGLGSPVFFSNRTPNSLRSISVHRGDAQPNSNSHAGQGRNVVRCDSGAQSTARLSHAATAPNEFSN